MFHSWGKLDKRSRLWLFLVVFGFQILVFVFSPDNYNLNILKLNKNFFVDMSIRLAAMGLSFLVLKRLVPTTNLELFVSTSFFMNFVFLAIAFMIFSVRLIGGV